MYVLFIPSPRPTFSNCFITYQIPICPRLHIHSHFNRPGSLRCSPLSGIAVRMLMYFQITAVGWSTGVQFPAELGIIPLITMSTHTHTHTHTQDVTHLAFYAIPPVLPPRPLYAAAERFLIDYFNSKTQMFNSETDSCTACLEHSSS